MQKEKMEKRKHHPLPECKDSKRSVGFVTGVATQVASPEIISPDVAQGGCWFQVLQCKNKIKKQGHSCSIHVI